MKANRIRINILDVIIVVFLIFAIVGVFARIKASSAKQKGDFRNVTIELNVTDETKELTKSLYKGSVISINNSSQRIGTVKSAVNRSNFIYVQEDGLYTKKYNDDIYRVVILLDSSVISNENGMFIDGKYYVAPGLTLQLKSEKAVFDAEIVDIELN